MYLLVCFSLSALDLGCSESWVFLYQMQPFGWVRGTVVGGREGVWRQCAETYTPKPQNLPKNNKNINHWPKAWWNSIFLSLSTSKHENAIPEGWSKSFVRGEGRKRKASLEKESSNFYTLQSLEKLPHSDKEMETFFTPGKNNGLALFSIKSLDFRMPFHDFFFDYPCLFILITYGSSLLPSTTASLAILFLKPAKLIPILDLSAPFAVPFAKMSFPQIIAGCHLLLFRSCLKCHLLWGVLPDQLSKVFPSHSPSSSFFSSWQSPFCDLILFIYLCTYCLFPSPCCTFQNNRSHVYPVYCCISYA